MKLIHTHKAKELLNEAEDFLLLNESQNNLFLGLAARLCETNRDEGEPFFYIVKSEQGDVLGASMRSAPNRPLVLTKMDKDSLFEIIKDLKERKIVLEGAVGHNETVMLFGDHWGMKVQTVMDQGIYECRELKDPREVKGSLHQVSFDDKVALESAIAFGAGFIQDCFPKHREPLIEARKAIEFYVEKGLIFLWQDLSGEFVSMAANNRESKNAGTIGWVYTPPQKRGKGYGTMVTHGVTQEVFKKGKTMANLFTDLNNLTSNSIYQQIGYKLLGNSVHIEFS